VKKVLEVISYLSLVLVVGAPVLFYTDRLTLDQCKWWMLVATIVWFASASFWIGAKKPGETP
jgi:hypothetical protein